MAHIRTSNRPVKKNKILTFQFIPLNYTIIEDPNLQQIDKYVFRTCGLTITNLVLEPESQEYTAQDFELKNCKFKYRTAKITPTKIGQFVTLWQRTSTGIIAPFEIRDHIDFYIIATRKDHNLGIFIFPKMILFQKGILSGNGKEGKRGFRVYPDWDITENKQAQKTQGWQKLYFLQITGDKEIDLGRAKKLLEI